MTQILVSGGRLLMHLLASLVLQVLFLVLAGVIVVICVGQALCLAAVDKAYRKSLFGSASDKRKR
jgi:hypothetical protein